MMKKYLTVLLLSGITLGVYGQRMESAWHPGADGCIDSIVTYSPSGERLRVGFFDSKGVRGPSLRIVENGADTTALWSLTGNGTAETTVDGIGCRIVYGEDSVSPYIDVTLTNGRHTPFQPEKAGLRLGIDTYMANFPEWLGKMFPTMLLCEKTHFHGYMQSPEGGMLVMTSDAPLASWSIDHSLGYQQPKGYWFMGHRIVSVELDLMSALPLPERHPQDLWSLASGDSIIRRIRMAAIDSPSDYERTVAELTSAPMIVMERTSTAAGQDYDFSVIGSDAQIAVTNPDGRPLDCRITTGDDGMVNVCVSTETPGTYTIDVRSGDKMSQGKFTARTTWRKVMERARRAAADHPQKASSHIESCYGFHSAFTAARHFPDPELDSALDNRFEQVFTRCFGTDSVPELQFHQWRIQNTSSAIGMLADRYEAFGRLSDLERASRMADRLIERFQTPDGAFTTGGTVYTSVIYMAKSLLELVDAERAAGLDEAATRHEESARRAIDQLVKANGDFNTEGELTFEDGMISCSALQIALMGLHESNPEARARYASTARSLLESHDCLTQLRVPDGRRRGGTLRFWEAQYDVLMMPNMFNTPHGWSAWRAYATYYVYLLTGDERWLRETFNAASSLANLIDPQSGQLHWAFVPEPRLEVRQVDRPIGGLTADSLTLGNPHPDLHGTRSFVIGEQYVDPVSSWQHGNTQDNDVHEAFKFIAEAMLCNAFVVQREDGTFGTYNCRITKADDGHITVEADEPQMRHLHVNAEPTLGVTFDGDITRFDRQ